MRSSNTSSSRTTRFFPFLAVGFVSLIGFSASGTSASRPTCDMMLRSDAEAAVGQALPQTTEQTILGMCDYNTPDFAGGASLTVGGWEEIKAMATGSHAVPTAIGGVGDEALNLINSNGSYLYVRVKSQGFCLILHGPKIDGLPDHGLAKGKGLAQKIVPRF
jgi:hypothetical protein